MEIGLYTFGELYLSPIGLSFVTKVAPVRMVSMMMGVWYLANFIGNYMTGYLGTFYETMPKAQFFQLMTTIGIVAGMIDVVKKVMGDFQKDQDAGGGED